VLLGAPTGSGKTISAELCMLRCFSQYPGQKVRSPAHGMQQADQGPAQHICPCTVSFLAVTQPCWAP
jgi:replicative superfamily II helicase